MSLSIIYIEFTRNISSGLKELSSLIYNISIAPAGFIIMRNMTSATLHIAGLDIIFTY